MPTATKYFTANTPQGMSTIKLDSKGCGTCQITVKNVSHTAIDGRGVLVSLPITRPAAGSVEKGWVKIAGAADRHFEVDQEEVFSIQIAVPQPKKGPAPEAGNYSFRLDVVNVARPDDSADQSQALGFAVAPYTPPPPTKWPLIALIVGLALLIGGVTTWLLLRKSSGSPTPVPRPTPIPHGGTVPPPDACKPGFVWRQIIPGDHVCVTPEVRAQVLSDNAQAAARRNPSGGPYGPDTCLAGYVWRDAVSNDHVCVTGAVRAQAATDNSLAAARRMVP